MTDFNWHRFFKWIFWLNVWPVLFYVTCCSAWKRVKPEEEVAMISDRHIEEYTEDFTEEVPLLTFPEEAPPPPRKKFIGYDYRIPKVGDMERVASCYSRYDSDVEAKGEYACKKYTFLEWRERNIYISHYTVALAPEDDIYFRTFLRLPRGMVVHAYLFHVPEYNKGNIQAMEDVRSYFTGDQRIRDYLYQPYFSVPRDRMKKYSPPRIDVLLTGCPSAVSRKKGRWGLRNDYKVDIHRVKVYAKYSDGTEEDVTDRFTFVAKQIPWERD